MKSKMRLAGAVLLAFAAHAAADDIFRCTARDSSVTYQQLPCSSAASGGAVDIPTTYPDHREERDRLMRREAALDARLMKRLEIDAAERIARDDRIARERELQAARERAQDTAPTVFVVAPRLQRRPYRPAWPAAIR